MSTEIRLQHQPQSQADSLRDLIMAWARDQDTGEPRYIFELDADRRGNKSRCICPSCLEPLTAANVAKAEYIRRPHFRHPPGTEKHSCSIVAARIALLKEIQADGWIQLPQSRRKATATGLSGQTYEAWVAAPAEKMRIANVNFQDHARALLTLDDGRQLEVLLTGSAAMSTSNEICACLTINVEDSEVASLSPEEIRKRLTLMPDWLCWQSHWQDNVLDAEAQGLLHIQMIEAMEVPPSDLDLSNIPAELRRETVLHYLAKQILRDAGEIQVPAIHHEVSRHATTGAVFTRTWSKPEATLTLTNIELECRLGNIVPDVVCDAQDELGNCLTRLCIEITVTNTIGDERRTRLQQGGDATLEVDLSQTGGRLNLAEFKDMLVREIAFKNWIWHPEASAALIELEKQVLDDVQKEQIETKNSQNWREEVLAMDVGEIGRRYLAAVTAYLQEPDHLDNSESGASRHELASKQSEMYRLADMLEIHGYLGGKRINKRQAARILARFLSLKQDRGVGYRVKTGFEVLNAVWQSRDGNRQDIPMYLAAARLWKIHLSDKQAETVQMWRREVKASIAAREAKYLRQPINDRLLALLFPDLAGALAATTRYALQKLFLPNPQPNVRQDGFLTGPDLERWLQDHPDSASAWEHLRSRK